MKTQLDSKHKVGSVWFQRLARDLPKISPHLRLVRIKYGFYRIYWKQAYIGECFKEMTQIGYDIEERNFHYDEQKYFEEYEDRAELTRKLKNFVEGYWEMLDRVRTRAWLMKHDREFYNNATQGYKQLRVK